MPFFSSSLYHVSTSLLSRTPLAAGPSPQYPPAVRSVLQDVLQRLGEQPATPAAARLRSDVKDLLEAADDAEARLERAPLPSLAQALEWRDRARFDPTLRPDALARLLRGKREFLRRCEEDSVPTDSPPRGLLLQWEADLHRAMDGAGGRPPFSRLRDFNARLEALDRKRQDFVAARDAHIAAKVSMQANHPARRPLPGCATLSSARPPAAPSPAPD